MTALDRAACAALDRTDPLADRRACFALEEGLIYLDGNSLGPLPTAVPERLATTVRTEWGRDLITSWNRHHWIDLPSRVGDRIGRLIGAAPGRVMAADSTSLNLFKVLAAGLRLTPGRRIVLSEVGNFPTDLYMVQGLEALLGSERCTLRLVEKHRIPAAIDSEVAIVMLTHVDFRSGQMHPMRAVTEAAHDAGALMLWDLAHSAGAVPVDLDGCNVDFAVGCGYKYLNGGPGAPAFLYAAPRHQEAAPQPLSGWMGHKAPFAFEIDYTPANAIGRYLCGTPAILGLQALDAALGVWDGVDMAAVRIKSSALSDLFIALMERRCGDHGFRLASPRDADSRGSQVSFAHDDGYAIMQALIEHRVVGDFRAPNLLRFGFTPLYTRYVDAWDAVDRLATIMETRAYDHPRHQARAAVT